MYFGRILWSPVSVDVVDTHKTWIMAKPISGSMKFIGLGEFWFWSSPQVNFKIVWNQLVCMIPSKKLAKTQLISDKFCSLTVVKSAPSRTKQNRFFCFSAFPTSARTFQRSIDLPSRPTMDAQRMHLQQPCYQTCPCMNTSITKHTIDVCTAQTPSNSGIWRSLWTNSYGSGSHHSP